MPNSNVSTSRTKVIAFIDYKPAELRMQKDWIIVYYAKNPLTQKMERQRLRVPVLANKRDRERHANRIVVEINKKLAEGWSPFLESTSRTFKAFSEGCDKFLEQAQKEIRDGIKREDTLRTYKSFLSQIHKYMAEKKIKLTFALEFNKSFVQNYLDWVYYEKENSPRTYNNHLFFIRTFANYLIDRGYLKENPTTEISNKRNGIKKRKVFPDNVRTLIRKSLPYFSREFHTLCMVTFYGFIRRTEMTKLRVKDIDLLNDVINIPGDASKNRYDGTITIPADLKPLLERHIQNARQDDYLFSAMDFKPGSKQLIPKKITDTWIVFGKNVGLDTSSYQFYSLKDTGITYLFEMGVPALHIRDQARHKDLKETMKYAASRRGSIGAILNSGASF
jgi:integrase/recombinase XerD